MAYLSVTRGDDEILDIVVTDEDTGAPVDLTGAALHFMVKARPRDDDADALIDLELGSGVTVTNAVGGLATVDIAAADTDDLAPGAFWWELQAQDATNRVITLAGGRFAIVADIVRSVP